jgi:tetratricopeptide (TPR) repeat protein/TolB-like protein
MGEVFQARDRLLGRDVAIKRLLQPVDDPALRRTLREARALAHLSHANVASVFDLFEDEHGISIVMEYIDGVTLSERVRDGAIGEAEALAIGRQVADALDYAHRRGVVHCDIKPSNLMITDGNVVKVLDFGIALMESAAATTATRSTTERVVRGTPAYMAPELFSGRRASPSTDVYALGVTLFELVTGRRPSQLASPPQRPPRLAAVANTVSAEFDAIVGRALEPDPVRRFATAAELKGALDALAMRTRAPRRVGATVGVLIAALVAACAALVATAIGGSGTVGRAAPTVLGVLVFNDTGDAANDRLAGGLTDVIVTRLAGTDGLAVVSRTALLPYLTAGRAADAMRDLGLTHALTVGMQQDQDRIRLTMGLVSGRDTRLLWAGVLTSDSRALVDLQNRVADAGLRALRANGVLSAGEAARVHQRRLTDVTPALEAFASGRRLLERSDVPGNIDRAVASFQDALAKDPRFVAAHAALGEAAWAQYRATRDTRWVTTARESIGRALDLEPDNADVIYALAVLEHGVGRVDEALAALERALALQPSSDDAYRLLGRIYSERAEYDRAVDALQEALRLRPDYPATVRALGLAYYDGGRMPEAISAFTRATILQPDNAPNYQLLGTAQQAAGALDQALEAYNRANAVSPRATAYSNIGVIHHTRGEYSKAADAYRQAIALQPREATTHRNLADALWMLGQRREAAGEYDAAIALTQRELAVNPNLPRVRALLAYCLAKLGRATAARAAIGEALRLAPRDPEVVYKQAVVELLGGRHAEAGATLVTAVSLGYSVARLDADRDLDPLRPLPAFPVPR